MKQPFIIAVLLTLALSLTGCGSLKRSLGLMPSAPDEFAVSTNSPLSVPPEFALRPPVTEKIKPAAISEAAPRDAKALLFSANGDERDNKSQGERSLLASAGVNQNEDMDIRSVLKQEYARREKEKSSKLGVFKSLVRWQDEEDPIVDAAKERKRLEENADSGISPAEGDTPVLGSGRSSLF
jgi:hypothetical protein